MRSVPMSISRKNKARRSQPMVHFRRPAGREVGLLVRLEQLLRNVGLTLEKLVAFAGQEVGLGHLAVAAHADVAEVAQKPVALHLAQPIARGIAADAGGPGVLLDGEEAVAVDEVEA